MTATLTKPRGKRDPLVSTVEPGATVKHSALLAAIKAIAPAITPNRALPLLTHALIDLAGDRMALSATNLELGLRTDIAATVAAPGRVAIDVKLLAQFLADLDGGPVALSLDHEHHKLTVTCDGATATLNGLDPDDFPVIPANETTGLALKLDPAILRRAIGRTEHAAAKEDSRPVLAALLVRLEKESLTLAAADGFRLAVFETPSGLSFGERVDLLCPARTMRTLAGLLAEAEDDVIVRVTPNQSQLATQIGATLFTTRLIEGTFPDFRQIIPREAKTLATIERRAFAGAVKRAMAFAKDNNDVVRFQFTPAPDDLGLPTLGVSAAAAERGNAEETIELDTLTGPEVQIAFNGKYVLEALAAFEGEQVAIGLNGGTQAATLRPVGDETTTVVAMPMVVQ